MRCCHLPLASGSSRCTPHHAPRRRSVGRSQATRHGTLFGYSPVNSMCRTRMHAASLRSSAWFLGWISSLSSARPMPPKPGGCLERGWSAEPIAHADRMWESRSWGRRKRTGGRRTCPRISRRTLVPSGEDGSQGMGAAIHARASGTTAVAVQGADDASSRSASLLGALSIRCLAALRAPPRAQHLVAPRSVSVTFEIAQRNILFLLSSLAFPFLRVLFFLGRISHAASQDLKVKQLLTAADVPRSSIRSSDFKTQGSSTHHALVPYMMHVFTPRISRAASFSWPVLAAMQCNIVSWHHACQRRDMTVPATSNNGTTHELYSMQAASPVRA